MNNSSYTSRFFPSIVCSILALLFLFPHDTFAFTPDSLLTLIEKESADKSVVQILEKAYKVRHENLELALAYGQYALQKGAIDKDHKSLFHANRDIGFLLEDNNRLQESVEYYLKALEISEKHNADDLKIHIYTDLAIVNRKMGRYKKTKDYHTKSLNLATSLNNHTIVEYSYHGLGYLYETIGDYEKAIEMYLKSLEVAETRKSQKGMITTLQNISTTYTKLDNYPLALETIEKAYILAEEFSDSLQIADVLFDYGDILQQGKKFDEALEQYKIVLAVYEKNFSKKDIARTLIQIAECYTEKGNYELAHNYFLKSLSYDGYIASELNANLFYKLGQLYLKKENIDQAKSSFEKSLKIAEDNDYKKLIQTNNHALYQIASQQEMPQEALKHLIVSSSMKDYLLNQDKSKRIAEMQFKFDAEKSEKEIQLLQLRQNKILLIGSCTTFLLFFIFLIYIIRMKGKNNLALEHKNEEIQTQNVKLRESNEVLKNFAYVAAHDLKEPLRNIGSFINLIQIKYGKNFNEEANEYMGFVKHGVKRLNSLLTDLLEYSQISAQEPEKEIIDIQQTLKIVESNLREAIAESHAQILIAPNLPNLHMSKSHLIQILQNVLSNAIKFCKNVPIIKIDCQIKDREFAIISVKDNGIGIDPSYGEKIFNLFHRLDRNDKFEGTGIGLSICKNIVDKYDGQISFESENGKGTTFLIKLPYYHNSSAKNIMGQTKILDTAIAN